MVHKAIQELWRPEPSELSLLLTKGIESTYLKVPPKAYTLTGSSDPCYVEAYHLADSIDGRITLHLKVVLYTMLLLCSLTNVYLYFKTITSVRWMCKKHGLYNMLFSRTNFFMRKIES